MKTVGRGIFGIALVIITAVVFISSGAIVVVEADEMGISSNMVHEIIRVNNDAELETLIATNHWNGSGTANDPYIIEDLEIDASGESSAVFIGNTTAFLIVRDCDFSGSEYYGPPYWYGGAITVYNATNVVIENNHCHDSESGSGDGIDVLGSDRITIDNNTLSDVWWGIFLNGSCDVTITNNSCHGIFLGIYLYESSNNNTIADNNCSANACGLSLESYSNDNVIMNNDLSGGNYSIYSWFSSNNTVMNNDCSGCHDYAIYLNNTNYARIENNDLIGGDGYGVYLESSDRNTISTNTIREMTEYGIYIDPSSDENDLQFNLMLNNHGASSEYDSSRIQAYDAGTGNWGHTGNYWSDWRSPDVDLDGLVDVPYVIDGGSNVDNGPLSLFAEIIKPNEQMDTFSDDVQVIWFPKVSMMAIAYYDVSIDGVNWITVNGMDHTFTGLDDGEYKVLVRAYDPVGNYGETSANFTVASGGDIYIVLYSAIAVTLVVIVASLLYLRRKQ